MTDIEHNYKVGVLHTGRIKVTVSAHMVALLVAEKLGLPMPERNRACEVCEVDPYADDRDSPDNQVWIGFDYRQAPTEGPVSITIPGPKPPPEPAE